MSAHWSCMKPNKEDMFWSDNLWSYCLNFLDNMEIQLNIKIQLFFLKLLQKYLQKCNYSITFALWRSAITFKWKKKFKLLIILVLLLVTIHSYSYTLLQQSFRCYYGLYNRVLPTLTYLFHCIKGLYTVRVDGAPVTFSQSGTVYDADPIQKSNSFPQLTRGVNARL